MRLSFQGNGFTFFFMNPKRFYIYVNSSCSFKWTPNHNSLVSYSVFLMYTQIFLVKKLYLLDALQAITLIWTLPCVASQYSRCPSIPAKIFGEEKNVNITREEWFVAEAEKAFVTSAYVDRPLLSHMVSPTHNGSWKMFVCPENRTEMNILRA